MKTGLYLTLVAIAATHSDVHGLTPLSDSDGPVRLLSCVVSPDGMLAAEVDNQGDDRMLCDLRCDYRIVDRKFSHWFNVAIPAHFNGRVGRFDTSNVQPGNYSGHVSKCEKTTAHDAPSP